MQHSAVLRAVFNSQFVCLDPVHAFHCKIEFFYSVVLTVVFSTELAFSAECFPVLQCPFMWIGCKTLGKILLSDMPFCIVQLPVPRLYFHKQDCYNSPPLNKKLLIGL